MDNNLSKDNNLWYKPFTTCKLCGNLALIKDGSICPLCLKKKSITKPVYKKV